MGERTPIIVVHMLTSHLCLERDDLHGRPLRPSIMLCGTAGRPAVLTRTGAGAGGDLALEGGYEAVPAGQLLLQQLQAGRLGLQGPQGIHLADNLVQHHDVCDFSCRHKPSSTSPWQTSDCHQIHSLCCTRCSLRALPCMTVWSKQFCLQAVLHTLFLRLGHKHALRNQSRGGHLSAKLLHALLSVRQARL